MALFIRHKEPGPLKPTANPYPSRFQMWRHSLSVTFILILICGLIFRFYKPFYDPIQQSIFEGTIWLQGEIVQPFQEVQALLEDTYTFMYLKEEYNRLKTENEKLKRQVQILSPLYHENVVLRQSLHIPPFEAYGHRTARILSSPYDGLHHFFLIDGGSKDGLEKDQAVISLEGVVGRLEKVGKYIARVVLLNDSNSRIPVMTATSSQKAILAGDGSFFPMLVYIGEVRKIQKGEQVVTSGLGGIFPPGLPVGIVEDISNGKIRVRPYASFQKMEWVHVLRLSSQEFQHEVRTALEEE
ncbi:MAG: rod shape-determining protein MreC [Proteobacteria bacterium]|nr:rod shape-determining protein MreC [Pseudomonadota bacterium]